MRLASVSLGVERCCRFLLLLLLLLMMMMMMMMPPTAAAAAAACRVPEAWHQPVTIHVARQDDGEGA
jgi:hypothetical protein